MLEQISASAGSGKTYALTRRFLELLAGSRPGLAALSCGLGPGRRPGAYAFTEILAATFTNRAAAEMRSRIIGELKKAALGLASGAETPLFDQGRARAWVEAVLRRQDGLNVRTIDSLLNMLVRLSALDLGLPPDFQPVFRSADYFDPLYEALLEDAKKDPLLHQALEDSCRAIFLHNPTQSFTSNARLRGGLAELLRLAMAGDTPLPDPDAEQLAARFAVLRQNLLDSATELERRIRAKALESNRNFSRFLQNCLDCPPLGLPDYSAYAEKPALADCLNKASKDWTDEADERAFFDFQQAFQIFFHKGWLYREALRLAPLCGLARILLDRLEDWQKQSGLVPGERIPGLARKILSDDFAVSDAFCRMGASLTHLLMDEFQDTSREQWAAILPLAEECLAKGGGFTFVGDVKQAIYSWRGGDYALFDQALREPTLNALCPHPKSAALPKNWRSAPAVVAFNNRIFQSLATPDMARAVAWAGLGRDTPPRWLDAAMVELQKNFAAAAQALPEGKTASSPGFVRLKKIIGQNGPDLTRKIRLEFRALFEGDLLGRRRIGDVAVLTRTNGEAAHAAEWLMELGLPVITENSLKLAEHPLLTRLAAFLAFLEYPPDDAAFWEFVSSPELFEPASGLDRAALTDWLLAERENSGKERGQPLYARFRQSFPQAWQEWIAPFFARAGLLSAYDSLSEIMDRYGLFARRPEDAAFLRRFLELAHSLEGRGLSAVADFLDFWRTRGGEEKLPLPEALDAVRVMTIHQAKGLEFPVVLLPFHHQTAPHGAPLLRAEVDGLPLIARLDKRLPEAYHASRLEKFLEILHLLYVAWTRAAEELHIFIGQSPHARSFSPLLKCLDALLATCNLEQDGAVLEEGQRPPRAAEPDMAAGERAPDPAGPPAFEPDWRPMNWLPRLKILRSNLEEAALGPERRGIFLHKCLEKFTIPESGPEPAQAERAVALALRAFLLPENLPEAARADLRDSAIRALAWFAGLPQAAFWLRHGLPEQSVMDEQNKLHRVDLLVDEGEAGLLAVEYKSGQEEAAHERQVRRYLELLVRACGRPARGLLVYLDLQKIREVAEA